jgi:tetratricopeptide (TPR) repeat protein
MAQQQRELTLATIATITGQIRTGAVDLPEGSRTPLLRATYDASLRLLDRMPPSPGTRRAKALNLLRLSEIWLQEGKPQRALVAAQEALATSRALVRDTEDSLDRQNVGSCYETLGDILGKLGRRTEALAAYGESLKGDARPVHGAASDETRRRLWIRYLKLGDTQLQAGSLRNAQTSYGQSLTIARERAKEENDGIAQRDLWRSYSRIGDSHHRQGQHRKALAAYEEALAVARALPMKSAADEAELRRLSRQIDALRLHLKQDG